MLPLTGELKKELWRKFIHMGIIIALPIAAISKGVLVLVIVACAIMYLSHESFVRQGGSVPFLSEAVAKAKRLREKEIAQSPFFMGLGVGITLLVFPFKPAAAGLLQLAFADVASAIIGITYGKHKLKHSPKKSWEGTTAYFLTALIVMAFFYSWPIAIFLAIVGAFIESLPYQDWDNLLIPLGVAALASLF
ncbi:MAG: hypothetical protein HYW02_01665 [Deltaproteobacteria bacterium]|nr:hypothetical protein [Deltaproteobacteria bacterium]MBI2500187.1 hypothetical protein [Deltaproteobacteria bacterium]